MKKILAALLILALIGSYFWWTHRQNARTNVPPPPANPVKKVEEPKVCKKAVFSELIDKKAWDDLYKKYNVPADQQLDMKSVVEYIQGNYEVQDYVSGHAVGISLDENDLKLESDDVFVSKKGGNYLINLEDDDIQYLISENFDETSTIQVKKAGESDFQDLCIDGDARYINIIKLILFRSAEDIYMYDLRDEGVL